MSSSKIKEAARDPRFLQYAPWFDPDRFYENFVRRLRLSIAPGRELYKCRQEFKDDIQEFCDGKLLYVPRYSIIRHIISISLLDAFQEAQDDMRLTDASNRLFTIICTPRLWTKLSRGANVKIQQD